LDFRSEINVTSSNAFFYLDSQYLLFQLVIEWIFSTTVLFDREGNYPCIYTDGSYKTTRQVFEQIEDMKIKCVSQFEVSKSLKVLPEYG
jgi:hypothetical protein